MSYLSANGLSILPMLGAIVGAGLLAVALVNWFRPDLFRFEAVAVTVEPAVIDALEVRVAALRQLTAAQLAELPEEQSEFGRLMDRKVLFHTTRTQLPDGAIQIAVTIAVKETPGLLSRPLLVAAHGFRSDADQVRTTLTDAELMELAMGASGGPFYDR